MSFKHPEFLYLLFAVLIPVIIHLFNFRRYKKIWFSNIQFLKNITTETRKQNKLKHLIVLFLRIIAIVLIALAFSGPEMKKEKSVSNSSSFAAIYIDNSYSMMSDGNNGRLFEKSLEQANDLVDQMPRDKQLVLLTNEVNSGRRLLAKDAFKAELNNVSVSSVTRKISSVIGSVINTRFEKEIQASDMYLFSDFQSWSFDHDNFPDDTSGYYYFLQQLIRQKKNIFLDSCWVSTPVILPGRPFELTIRIKNASEIDIDKVPLKVLVNGEQKAVAGVDLKAGSAEVVKVNFTMYEKGWHSGIIEIDDHPVIFDDKLYFSFQVQEKIKVLEINSDKNDDFLRSFYEIESLFGFQTMNYRQVDYSRFPEFNLVILNALRDVSSGLAGQIKEYVKSGGNLLFIPGPSSITTNNLLGALNAGSISSIDTTATRVSGINRQSKLFRDAISKIPENADLPRVFMHYKYRYAISSGIESLIGLLNGDDLLLMKNYEQGTIYLLAVPFGDDYSNLSSNPLFVPLMYNSAVQGNSSNKLFYVIGNDNILETEHTSGYTSESPFTLKNILSGYTLIPEQKTSNGKLAMNLHYGIENAGFYQLGLNDSVFQVFAFNYNRNESQMDFLNEEQIKDKLSSSGLRHFEILNNTENNIATFINSLQKENDLWKLFIIFALLMLLAEILILRFWK